MDFIQKTVVLVKPDGVKRGLVGDIVSRFERVGLKIVALKMVWVEKEIVASHYKDEREYLTVIGMRSLDDYKKYGLDPNESLGTDDPYEIGQMVRKWNMDALTVGPLVAVLIEGVSAIDVVRKMVGDSLLTKAVPGSIRGDFTVDIPILANLRKRPMRSIVHASGNVEEAEFEKKLWFKEKEIYDYKRAGEDL
mgnify:CR=1 FL=1